MVDALKSKVKAWENERNTQFLYDGVRYLFFDNGFLLPLKLNLCLLGYLAYCIVNLIHSLRLLACYNILLRSRSVLFP